MERGQNRDLRERTKAFALRIIRLYASPPNSGAAHGLGSNCFEVEPRWGPTTMRLAEPVGS